MNEWEKLFTKVYKPINGFRFNEIRGKIQLIEAYRGNNRDCDAFFTCLKLVGFVRKYI